MNAGLLVPKLLLLCSVTSVASDSVTPWPEAHQAPLTMGILQGKILQWAAISYSRASLYYIGTLPKLKKKIKIRTTPFTAQYHFSIIFRNEILRCFILNDTSLFIDTFWGEIACTFESKRSCFNPGSATFQQCKCTKFTSFKIKMNEQNMWIIIHILWTVVRIECYYIS